MSDKLWEAVALSLVEQGTGHTTLQTPADGLAGVYWASVVRNPATGLQIAANGILDKLYRAIDESKTDEPYPVALARELGLVLAPSPDPLRVRFRHPFTDTPPAYPNAVVLCPYAPKRELELPLQVWRHVARMMRSYGRPVLLLGDEDSRLDIATFQEGELLGRRPFDVIMATLRSAALVIGAANEWTWLAASFDTKIIVIYPDNQPPWRWYWIPSDRIGRAVFTPSNVQTPVTLSAIRKLAAVL